MTAKRWGPPLAVALVVVLVAGVAVWLARGSSTSPKPSVLHLGSTAGAARPMAAAIPAKQSPSTGPGWQPYKLVGTLPDGQPPDAPVYRLPGASAADAATVADALHLQGTPTRAHGGWVLRTGDKRLAVRDDGTWSFGMDCFSGPAAQEDLTVECAYASGGSVAVASPATAPAPGDTASPAPPPTPLPTPSTAPGPSAATARATAERVMHALGYDGADIVVNTADPTAYVQATPRLDGQPVANWTMSIAVSGDGSIDSGNGWIGTPQRDASYPLITAQRAFDLLQQQPRPMVDLCMVRPDGEPGCADIAPSEVTGASLGLALDYDAGKPVLVPAWLFAIKGQSVPVAQVAVEPAYLATPTPGPVPPETVPSEPVPPAQQAPPAPASSAR